MCHRLYVAAQLVADFAEDAGNGMRAENYRLLAQELLKKAEDERSRDPHPTVDEDFERIMRRNVLNMVASMESADAYDRIRARLSQKSA